MCVYRHGERPVSIKHGSRPGNEASDDGDKLYYYYHHFFSYPYDIASCKPARAAYCYCTLAPRTLHGLVFYRIELAAPSEIEIFFLFFVDFLFV